MRKIRIGTRKSKLAIAQSEWVASWLRERYPEFAVELVRITTSGDRIQDFPLSKVGGKGLFVKEIEEALLREEVDLAVHSLKDMPAELPKGLSIICYPEREDPRDALITNTPSDLETLSPFSRIGTSSLRRKCQLISMRKDLEIIPLRGNVDTRLKKLKTEGLDGIILAMAGINRLGIEVPHLEPIPLSLLIPAVGQGCLAIEARSQDGFIRELLGPLNHPETELRARAERSFLITMGGGCQVPMGAIAEIRGKGLILKGILLDWVNYERILVQREGTLSDPEGLGKAVGEEILSQGGREIIQRMLKEA